MGLRLALTGDFYSWAPFAAPPTAPLKSLFPASLEITDQLRRGSPVPLGLQPY